MQHAQKRKMLTGLTLASSLAWMSILPATAVFAQSGPMVTPGSVTLSGSTTSTLNGSATFSASAQDPNGTAEYQFWVEEPNGQWMDAQNYSTSNTFTLSTPSAGDYLVAVDVLDKTEVAAGQWNLAQTTLSDGVFVNSTVTVAANPTGNVPAGTPVTLTATATNIYDPVYQFWIETPSGEWMQSGNYQSSPSWTFTPTSGGTYTYVAYAKSPLAANNPHGALQSQVGMVEEYGQAAQVVVRPTSESLVADGQASGSVTFVVEDSRGDQVSNFSGTLTISSSPSALLSTGGGDLTATETAMVSGGIATVELGPVSGDGYVGQTFAVSADDLTNSVTGLGGVPGQAQVANINYSNATAMVSGAAPSASGISLTASTSALANNFEDGATVTAQITDQAGDPYAASNDYYVQLSITGPGSFSYSNPNDKSEIVDFSNSQSVHFFTQIGATSPVTISASQVSGDQLSPATPLTFDMYEIVNGEHLAISSSVSTGPVDGLTYTTYTVDLEDSANQIITRGPENNNGTASVSSTSGNLVYQETSPQNSVGQVPANASFGISQGVGTFTVENTGYESTPATLNITYGNLSGSVLYTYTKGLGEYATVAPNSTEYTPESPAEGLAPYGYSTVTAGETVNPVAQLADWYGNPVQEAGQSIYFRIDESGVASLPNGAEGRHDVYQVTTNASGQASIPVNILSSDAPGQHLYVETEGPDQSYIENGEGPQCALEFSVPYVVVPQYDYAANISTNLPGGTLVAGTSTSGSDYWVHGLNVAGGLIGATPFTTAEPSATYGATGIIEVTSSNPSVLGVGAVGTGTEYVELGSHGKVVLPNLVAGAAGTAMIKLTDVSTGATLSAPITYTVVPGQPVANAQLYYNGAPVSSSNEAMASSGQVTELWVKNVDAGGNPIDVTGTTPLDVYLPPVTYGEWATTSGGVASTTGVFVQIQPGSSSAPVFLEGKTSDTSTESATVSSQIAADAAQELTFSPSSLTMLAGWSSATSQTVTVEPETLYGQPVSSAVPVWLSFSSGAVAGASATATGAAITGTPAEFFVNSNGTIQVTITDPAGSVAGDSMSLTAQDEATNPSEMATLPINIGQPLTNAQLYFNGAPVSSTNAVSLSSSDTTLMLENVDAAGQEIAVPANTTGLTVILPAESGVAWNNGSADTSAIVTIPAGSSSVTVTVSGTGTLSSQVAMDAVQNLVIQNGSGTSLAGQYTAMGTGLTVYVMPENLFGAPLASANVDLSFTSGTTFAMAAVGSTSLTSTPASFSAAPAGSISVSILPGGGDNNTTNAVLTASVSGLTVSANFYDGN